MTINYLLFFKWNIKIYLIFLFKIYCVFHFKNLLLGLFQKISDVDSYYKSYINISGEELVVLMFSTQHLVIYLALYHFLLLSILGTLLLVILGTLQFKHTLIVKIIFTFSHTSKVINGGSINIKSKDSCNS